jgi:sensor domain CHASE-containing protein
MSGLIIFATKYQDKSAIDSSVHLTKAIIKAGLQDIAGIALDNGYWDQAVDNLVINFNPDWADENIGSFLFENSGVSSSYVLDGDNLSVYGSNEGERESRNPLKRYSGGLHSTRLFS